MLSQCETGGKVPPRWVTTKKERRELQVGLRWVTTLCISLVPRMEFLGQGRYYKIRRESIHQSSRSVRARSAVSEKRCVKEVIKEKQRSRWKRLQKRKDDDAKRRRKREQEDPGKLKKRTGIVRVCEFLDEVFHSCW